MSAAPTAERPAAPGIARAPAPAEPAAPAAARHRCVQLVDRFEFESGVVLRDVRQAYYLDGEFNARRDNLVVVFHALTGSADAAGDWWREVARMVAMMTYRTADELEARFGRRRHDDGRFDVERYLDHQGAKLRARFDVHSYLALLAAMGAHDVGCGRGGHGPALRRYGGRLVGVGTPGDLLYSDADVRRWVDAAGASYRELRSTTGHDAFLTEHAQVSAIVRSLLESDPLDGR